MARGIQFADQPRNRSTVTSRRMRFDMIRAAKGIAHRLTQPNHPCANGKVERMNRTIKDAIDKRFNHDSHDQLRIYLGDFMAADSIARRLKTLNGVTPYDYICKIWTSDPDSFSVQPVHQMPGLKTSEESLQQAQPLHGVREEQLLIRNERIPAPAGAFDIVFTACVFHHIVDAQPACLRELARLTRPGERLVLSQHKPPTP
jgi:SAM-dependent methyltransferase